MYLNHSSPRVPNLDLVPYQSFVPLSAQPYSLSPCRLSPPSCPHCHKHKEKLFPALYSALKFQAIIAVLQSFLVLLPAPSMLSSPLLSLDTFSPSCHRWDRARCSPCPQHPLTWQPACLCSHVGVCPSLFLSSRLLQRTVDNHQVCKDFLQAKEIKWVLP